MKKIAALVLVCLMIFMLAACNGGGGGAPDPTPTPEATPTPTPTPDPTAAGGEFFPGIPNDDIPDVLMRTAGELESAIKVPSTDPDFSYEVFIVLAEIPINFFSILSHHYESGSIEAEVPLDESLGRSFVFDWGYIEMTSKDLIIEEGKIEVHARMY